MLGKDAGTPIQAMPLGRGDAISPYTVLDTDTVVEFTEEGTVALVSETGVSIPDTTVLSGSRYSIAAGITTITFAGTFSIG